MPSNADIGFGITLGYADYPSPGAYVTIAELYDVGLPDVQTADVKVTHYTTANTIHEYIAGWKEGGDVSLQLNFTTDEYVKLTAIKGVKKTWKITLPDLSTVVWGGYLKSLPGTLANEDRMTLTGTIKVISLPVITYMS